MEEQYQNLTQYEKEFKFGTRFGALYRLYFSKLWNVLIKQKRTWLFNIIMISPVIAGPIIAIANIVNNGNLSSEVFFGYYSDIMFTGYIGIILPLFTMYIASMLFNDEKNNRSITYLTVRPIQKFELVLVKYLTYLSLVPLFTVITSGLIYLSFAAFGYFQYFTMFLWYLLAAVISSAVYGAVFMVVGLLFKNPLWFGLAFVLVWEFVFATFSDLLGSLTIAYYIRSLIVYDPVGDVFNPLIIGNQASVNNPATPLIFSVVYVMIIIISITLSWSLLNGDRFKVPYQAGRRPGGWKYYLKEIRSFLVTIGIIFIAGGLVIGPINGVTKNQTTGYQNSEDFNPDPYNDFGDDFTLEDMGFAVAVDYSFARGDDLSVTFNYFSYDYKSYMNLYGLVVEPVLWDAFVADAADLWDTYQLLYDPYGNNMALYQNLVDVYSDRASTFILSQADYWTAIGPGETNTTVVSITAKIDYKLVVIVQDFSTTGSSFLNYDAYITIDGIVSRTLGYSLGWVVFGVGILSGGFAIYSIVTYKSADEIQRYEEHIALQDEREELRLSTLEENNV
ncbi:MAG: ABC transporter permease [Candidatus Heimdallarchaeota archaeon]